MMWLSSTRGRLYCQDRPRYRLQLRIHLRLAFPDRKNLPSESLQPVGDQRIPSLVGRELCLPEVGASCGCGRLWTSRVLMPETAVYKNCHLAPTQDKVRATKKGSVMKTKPQSRGMQIPSHSHFRLRVAALDAAHHPGSNVWCDRISQMPPLSTLFSLNSRTHFLTW